MEELEPSDRRRVFAAEGWIELGLPDDAEDELAVLSPDAAGHPVSRIVFWRLHAARGNWVAALAAAQGLLEVAPEADAGWIQQSYALHELGRTREAWDLLLPMAEHFCDNAIIPYNLACYACRLEMISDAETWLAEAFRRNPDKRFKSAALSDPDLRGLQDYIRNL